MNTLNSHYVSQLLLRRFSTNKLVKVKNISNKQFYLRKPEEIAFLELPMEHFAAAEKKWCNKYEGKLGEAFRLLNEGSLLASSKHALFIIKFMALLYMRSLSTYVLLSHRADEELVKLLKQFVPMGLTESEVASEWISTVIKATPQTINYLLKKVEAEMLKYNLEIGYAPKGKIILSDVPVITKDSKGRVGALAGVSLLNSDTAILPLTPHYVAALTNKPVSKDYRILDEKAVRKINKLSRKMAIKEIYMIPD